MIFSSIYKLLDPSCIVRQVIIFPDFSYFIDHSAMLKPALLVILRVLLVLILSSWLCLWFLKPTEFWTRKWHKAEDIMQTTVLRYNGLSFAAFTFPIIGLAMIGFISLHLRRYSSGEDSRTRKVQSSATAFINQFVIISRTPIGTLSGVELLAIVSFILLLVWTFYAKISHDYKKLLPPVKFLELNEWQLKFLKMATRFGLLSETCLAFLLFPILRRTAIFQLLDIQFEASVRYHIWIGTLMIFFATLHGSGTLFIWGIKHRIQDQMWKWQKEGRIYLAGEICLMTGLIIWISSLPQVRRQKFAFFYYTHHLYVVFLLFFLFHAGDRHFYWIFPGIFLFALDKLLRIIQSRPAASILSARILPCRTIEITIPKDPRLHYTPTSIVFINIPILSRFQWHPFTIASSSKIDARTLSVMIKCEGSWTNDLYEMLRQELGSKQEKSKRIPVGVEGPYGPTSVDFLRYDNLLLVAGGIGITPFLSILKDLMSAKANDTTRFPSDIKLIFTVKNSQSISLLNPISSFLLNQSVQTRRLKLTVFITQEKQQKPTITLRDLLVEHSQEQTILFNTDGSYYAIYRLGNPLYLAAVIGLSSIVFILSLCFFNYIFLPSQKKSEQKKPSTIIDILLLCSLLTALACSTLVAILFRWKNLVKNIPSDTQKQATDAQLCLMETASYGGENEVRYGRRPNFQDILSQTENDFGGATVGVLVCGPESLKESVATACNQHIRWFDMSNKKKKTYALHSLNFTL